MRLLATFYFHFGKSRNYELFDCYKILRLEPERNNALFLISPVGCRTVINFGSLFSKNVYKLSTKTVESLKPGPNFLERPTFLDEYVVLKECYLVGVGYHPRHYHVQSKKAHTQLYWESRKCWNIYNKSLQICKHVTRSTIL
jgi:hypothetical protein